MIHSITLTDDHSEMIPYNIPNMNLRPPLVSLPLTFY